MVRSAAIQRQTSPIDKAGMEVGPASPIIRKPIEIICKLVFYLASLLTGKPTLISAKYSRRPDTKISLSKITSAGSTVHPVM